MGKVFPCVRATVSADPLCGETPQHPLQSERAEGISVTGKVPREAFGARHGVFPMNMQVLDSRRDLSGGYKVDVTRGERVCWVSSEWFSRPDDERFLSLGELARSVRDRSERSRTRVVETALIHVEASRTNGWCGRNTRHWLFLIRHPPNCQFRWPSETSDR